MLSQSAFILSFPPSYPPPPPSLSLSLPFTGFLSFHPFLPHREQWYGILFSQTSTTKKSNLLLAVFYPNSDIPWLGPFSYLGPKPVAGVADPRRAAGVPPVVPALEQEKALFPVLPPRHPSFQTPSTLLWASESVLQVCVCVCVCITKL